uniref:Si:ch73-21g5.7 n=1 Tax=Seriola lalandi dorsalis TaxID=1841481 RepID=A0A3B4Y946_SERLL
CKLHMLERKCSTGVEKLKALIEEHLHNGIPVSDILEKTKSFLTLRKALLSHSGYSKYSRDILRLFPDAEEDVAPLCF